jgi:hypothetical protein
MEVSIVFDINGDTFGVPLDYQGLEVIANFDDGTQPAFSISDVVLVEDNARSVIQYIEDGRFGGVGIFEGIPYNITISDDDGFSHVLFEGILDLSKDYKELTPNKVQCQLKSTNDAFSIMETWRSNTFGYLYEVGDITSSDTVRVPYVVEKLDYGLEFLILSVTTFIVAKETIERIKNLGESAKETLEGTIPSLSAVGPVVAVGKIVGAVIKIALEVAYIALMIIYLLISCKAKHSRSLRIGIRCLDLIT